MTVTNFTANIAQMTPHLLAASLAPEKKCSELHV